MIAVFVDKEFLSDFFIVGEELSSYNDIYNLLTGFAEKTLFHNFEGPEEFLNNPLGKVIMSNGVTSVIEGTYDDFNSSEYATKISFTGDNENIAGNGVINFKISNLDENFFAIKSKSEWVVYLDDKEERKKAKDKWQDLSQLKISEIQLIDKYLPKKRDDFKDFCKDYISSLGFDRLSIDIYADNLTKNENETEREKEHIKKLGRALKSICPARISKVNYYRIFGQLKSIIDFHDRLLISNLFIIDVGVGFENLLTDQETNSKLTCESILNEKSYNRIRRLKKKIKKYKAELKKQTKVPAYLLTNLENF